MITVFSSFPTYAQQCTAEAEFSVKVNIAAGTVEFCANNIILNATYECGYQNLTQNTQEDFMGMCFTIPKPNNGHSLLVYFKVTTPNGVFQCEDTYNFNFTGCDVAGFNIDFMECTAGFDPLAPSGTPISHTWNFGDGSPEVSSFMPIHTYSASGTYLVEHAFVEFNPNDNFYYVDYCEQNISVTCSVPCPPDFMIEQMDCCNRVQKMHPSCTTGSHSWSVTYGGSQVFSSNEVMPTFCFSDFESDGSTPFIITHTTAGMSTSESIVFDAGIYVGDYDESRNISTVNSIIASQGLLFLGNSISEKNIFANGDFRIDKDFTFELCEFQMCPNSQISVEEQNILTTSVSNLQRFDNCECLWRGIEALSDSDTRMANTTIQDAMYAILVNEPNIAPRLNLNENLFLNNYIGIGSLNGNFIFTNFKDNIFDGINLIGQNCMIGSDCNGASITPLSMDVFINKPMPSTEGYAGILVVDQPVFNIPTPSINTNPNIFRNLSVGMWLENTNAMTRACQYENILTSIYPQNLSGYGIYYLDFEGSRTLNQKGLGIDAIPTFNTCETAIRVDAWSTLETFVQIDQNRGINLQRGFDIAEDNGSFQDIFIYSNDMSCSDFGLSVDLSSSFGNIGGEIENNFFTINGPDIFLRNGIQVFGSGIVNFFSTIDQNLITLEQGNNGILMQNISGMSVRDNNVNIEPPSANPNWNRAGIFVTGSPNNSFSCNNVMGVYSGGFDDTHAGIRVDMSQSNSYNSNTVTDVFRGMVFNGDCIGSDDISCNTFVGSQYIGLHYSGVGSQTGIHIDGGNTWDASFSGLGAEHCGGTGDITASQYFTSIFPPSLNTCAPGNWFIPSSNTPTCNTECFAMVTGGDDNEIKSLDVAKANEGIDGNISNELTEWIDYRYLYKKLRGYPSLESNHGSLGNFRLVHDNTIIGDFYDVSASMENLYELPINTQLQTANLKVTVKDKLAAIADIDAALTNANSSTQQTSLLNERITHLDDLVNAQAGINSIREQEQNNRTNGAPLVAANNNALTNSTTFQNSEKEINQIFLETFAQNNLPNAQQAEEISIIASQCAETSGLAVYWARALHYKLTGEIIYEESCQQGSDKRLGKTQAEEMQPLLKMAPNPTTGNFKVQFNEVEEMQGLNLEIFNSLGQLVFSSTLNRNFSHEIELQNFNAGLYFCQFSNKDKILQTEKLIIITP